MDEAMENSLEDWVAVKPNLFASDGHNPNYRFFVAWNDAEQKLAITCSQGSRKVSDKSTTSLATSLRQKQTPIDDSICRQLEDYLEKALHICGKRLFLSLLFDEHPLSDFEENLQELRLKGHENVYRNALNELEEVLKIRKRAENMIEMSTVYAIEDEVVANVSIALAELYNFQIQPFLQLREIAFNSKKKAETKLKDDNLGERIKREAKREYEENNDQYLAANEALQHLYQEYYRKTSELVGAQVERMLCDKGRFGRSAFDVVDGPNRLLRLQVFLCQERLKLLNAIKLSKECQRDQMKLTIKRDMSKEESKRADLELLEAEISILDIRLDISTEEETLLKKQIEILKNNDSKNVEVELFYDAVEDLRDLLGDEENTPNTFENPKIDSLKAKLEKIFRRRANLRNKRKFLISERSRKQQDEAAKANLTKHNSFSSKRNEKAAYDKKNEEYLKNARLKTLQRLRLYRQKTQKNSNENSKVQKFLDESGNELPPYPRVDFLSPATEEAFPLPPEEFLEK
ncbi:junction-mediating and -regulatory protein-like protein, partial [Dinothrombium tinctorium]